jgi:hypothetical protein
MRFRTDNFVKFCFSIHMEVSRNWREPCGRWKLPRLKAERAHMDIEDGIP